MKIFVTGGTGFIGKPLVSRLSSLKHDVLVLTRQKLKESQYLVGDLKCHEEWEQSFLNFNPDCVIHLAWQGLPDYSLAHCQDNLYQTLNLLSLAGKSSVKLFLSTGSCWEYESRQGQLHEKSPILSTQNFPATKNALRILGESMAKEFGFKFYWPRLFFVYGPGQRDTSLIPLIIRSLRQNQFPAIRNYNNGNDFVYVEDVVNAILKILKLQPSQTVYNIGSGISTSVKDVYQIVSEILGKDIPLSAEGDKQEFDNYWADLSLITQDIQWAPQYTLSEGIKRMVTQT